MNSSTAIANPASDAENTLGTSLPYWSAPAVDLFIRVGSGPLGLEAKEAARRLASNSGPSLERRGVSVYRVLLEQLGSPLLLLLVFAATVSALTREWVDAGLVLSIVILSVGVGGRREYKGQAAAAALAARIRTRATVVRGGVPQRIPANEVVVGDVVLLAAGSLVPADAIVIDASDCHVNEAVLTGEAFSVEKAPGVVLAGTPLARRSNAVFQGSNVQSGTARCLVVATGAATEYGAIAKTLLLRPPETEFDRGLRHFGYLLVKVMLVITVVVFIVHVALDRPPLATLLFAIALAVGLSPELRAAQRTVCAADDEPAELAGGGHPAARLAHAKPEANGNWPESCKRASRTHRSRGERIDEHGGLQSQTRRHQGGAR